ncbi:DsbA family protein [Viridibacillus arvi]|uniref:DsbA family protein n=1 Tax=Viridibacillus arvi TaxID=263475 RepID=UPI003D05A6E1
MGKSYIKFAVPITVVVAALLVIFVISNNKPATGKEIVNENAKEIGIDLTGQPLFGHVDAPITIVEFGDFKCPPCKYWGETIYPKLVEDYISNGNVKFSYVNVLFHGRESLVGAIAAESVYQQSPDVYWSFHKALYDAQPKDEGQWITIDKLLQLAKEFSSIDQEQLKQDIEQEVTKDKVRIDGDLVTKHNITVTPTIIINDTIMVDPFDYEAIKEAIDQKLEDKINE